MAKKKGPTYTVGYGKPPKASQFPPGVSGNVAGRPKGIQNMMTVLRNTMQEKIVIVENGRKKTVTKLDASIKQLVRKAMGGDMAAFRILSALLLSAEEKAQNEQPATVPFGRSESRLLQDLMNMRAKQGKDKPRG